MILLRRRRVRQTVLEKQLAGGRITRPVVARQCAVGNTELCLDSRREKAAEQQRGNSRRQLGHCALVVTVVERRIPREPVLQLNWCNANNELDTLVSDLSSVNRLDCEARRVRDRRIEDLIPCVLVVPASVERDATVEQAELESKFSGVRDLRFQRTVGKCVAKSELSEPVELR